MRFALIVLALTLCGCSTERTVTTPTPAPPTVAPAPTPTPPPAEAIGFLAGMVISDSGACIRGAVVEIVGGQGIGRKMSQTAACSWWDWEDGFMFPELLPDVQLTIRASASGYGSKESTFTPSLARNSSGSYLAVVTLDASR